MSEKGSKTSKTRLALDFSELQRRELLNDLRSRDMPQTVVDLLERLDPSPEAALARKNRVLMRLHGDGLDAALNGQSLPEKDSVVAVNAFCEDEWEAYALGWRAGMALLAARKGEEKSGASDSPVCKTCGWTVDSVNEYGECPECESV